MKNHMYRAAGTKSLLFIVIIFMLHFCSLHAQQVKVLFIGSSLTAFNNQPNMFSELAAAAGKDAYVLSGAIPGHNLTDHFSLAETMAKVNQEQWDYVILENGDYTLVYPDEKQNVYAIVDSFIAAIHNNCPTTKIIFFMDWAMKNGVMHDGVMYSFATFQQMLYDATLEIADEKNMLVAPIGSAWGNVIDGESNIELYAPDNGHPSLLGSYLGACVYYSVIFQESCSGNSFTNDIPLTDASYLQNIASETVLQNLELWNLITSIDDKTGRPVESFALHQNFPNPFNPATTITFDVKETSQIDLVVYNLLGEKIAAIINGREFSPGSYSYQWNGKKQSGQEAGSGIYLCMLNTDNAREVRKMVLLK